MNTPPVVQARGLRKEFPGQVALAGLDLDLVPGRVHALVGSNGSGKSTFIKLLAGSYTADAGTTEVAGEVVTAMTPARAYRLGLRFLHQRPTVFPALSVADNIALASKFVGSGPWRRRGRVVLRNAQSALEEVGLDVHPDVLVGSLSPVQRTMVAVAAALQRPAGAPEPRLLVLDEPTAALPEHEVGVVFDLVRAVTVAGVSVLYVSHRLPEVVELADHLTVLRDGRCVHQGRMDGVRQEDLVRLILGEELAERPAAARSATPSPAAPGRPVLTTSGLRTRRLRDVNLTCWAGEVVGVAGLLGTGRSELLRVLAGVQHAAAGTVAVEGRTMATGSPSTARRRGVAYIPEDRLAEGVFPACAMSDNLLLPGYAAVTTAGRVSARRQHRLAADLMAEHDVNPRLPDRPISAFSGGNQQKAVVARSLRSGPKVVLADEPTQAVDIRAKAQIHARLRRYAESGGAVLVVSSDFAELAVLCDRVLVARGGRLDRELSGADLTEQRLLEAASWGVPDVEAAAPPAVAVHPRPDNPGRDL